MAWLGWIAFGLMFAWWVMSMMHTMRRRIHLTDYAIYLLLSDDIRGDHQQKFREWIRSAEARDAADLSHRAHGVVENMAAHLGRGGSTLATHAMVWQVRKAATG
ncbi:MAG TPA: hypothetical protein VFD84_20980 [Candidatus Binatia bacterium]|nr:hypothetical protein [Candidatus Binatia bacterium]